MVRIMNTNLTKDVCRIEQDYEQGITLLHLAADVAEYVKISTLSKMFGVSRRDVVRKLEELSQSYQIRTCVWGNKVTVVHLADFRHALFDSARQSA